MFDWKVYLEFDSEWKPVDWNNLSYDDKVGFIDKHISKLFSGVKSNVSKEFYESNKKEIGNYIFDLCEKYYKDGGLNWDFPVSVDIDGSVIISGFRIGESVERVIKGGNISAIVRKKLGDGEVVFDAKRVSLSSESSGNVSPVSNKFDDKGSVILDKLFGRKYGNTSDNVDSSLFLFSNSSSMDGYVYFSNGNSFYLFGIFLLMVVILSLLIVVYISEKW